MGDGGIPAAGAVHVRVGAIASRRNADRSTPTALALVARTDREFGRCHAGGQESRGFEGGRSTPRQSANVLHRVCGSPEARITTGNHVSLTRTARSAFPAVLLDLTGPCRESGKTGVEWRDSRRRHLVVVADPLQRFTCISFPIITPPPFDGDAMMADPFLAPCRASRPRLTAIPPPSSSTFWLGGFSPTELRGFPLLEFRVSPLWRRTCTSEIGGVASGNVGADPTQTSATDGPARWIRQ